jgi:hypothetical protein
MKKQIQLLIFSFGLISNITFSQNNFFNLYTDTSGLLLENDIQQMIPTHDNGLIGIAGPYDNDSSLSIFKFDSSGQNVWIKKFHVHDYWMYPGEIIELQNNDFICTGVFYETAGQIHSTDFILKMDSLGNLKSFLVNEDSMLVAPGWGNVSIASTGLDGELIYSGPIDFPDSLSWTGTNIFLTKVDSTANVIWNTFFQPDTGISLVSRIRAKKAPDGSYLLTGIYSYIYSNGYNFFIAKIDSTGNLNWSKHQNSPSSIQWLSKPIELNGYYYILCTSVNNTVIFKVDIYGQLIWYKQYDDFYPAAIDKNLVNLTSGGRIVFTGRDKVSLSPLVIEIDSSGSIVNTIQYYSPLIGLTNLIQNPLGKYFFYGSYSVYQFLILSSDSLFQPNCITTTFNLNPPSDITDTFVTGGSSYHTPKTFLDLTPYVNLKNNFYLGSDLCSILDNITHPAVLADISIYPNPANNQFSIFSGQIENATIEIFNLLGEKIYSTAYREQLTINCEHFPRGIYLVRLTGNEMQVTMKLVVD